MITDKQFHNMIVLYNEKWLKYGDISIKTEKFFSDGYKKHRNFITKQEYSLQCVKEGDKQLTDNKLIK